jgi:hypothetical protein
MASGLAGTVSLAASGVAGAAHHEQSQHYLEMRTFTFEKRSSANRFHRFLEEAAIPAVNRMGIKPVGVFRGIYGAGSLTTYVLLPHSSMESVVHFFENLMSDEEFQKSGAEGLNASHTDPLYTRMESNLMLAFKDMPHVEAPDTSKDRIFELRRYESHSVKANKKKIEMFNEGGEIAIFRRTGLHPVFFGESIVGPNLPNLTYMLTFADMAERDKNWGTFVNDPEWEALSGDPQYDNTVSNIEDTILRPTDFSQI